MRQEDECIVALLKDYFIATFFVTESVAISLNKIYKLGEQDKEVKREEINRYCLEDY